MSDKPTGVPAQAAPQAVPPDPHVLYNNIPEELKRFKNWVTYRLIPKGEKISKVPYNPLTGYGAKSDDPSTWVDYATAVKYAPKYNGIGFMWASSPYVGVDLDHHINAETGEPDEFAKSVLDKLASYSEISPSGDGCHIIVKADVSESIKNSKCGIEIYPDGRYFTMTGRALPRYGNMIQERTAEVLELLAAYTTKKPQEQPQGVNIPLPQPLVAATDQAKSVPLDNDDVLIMRMRKHDNTGKFVKLFDNGDISGHDNDHSKADSALLQTLAYFTNCDPVRMEQLFNRSALAQREKWQTRQDYRDRSIKRAIEMCIQSSPKVFGEAKVLFDSSQFFGDKDKFLHEKFGDYLIKKAHIIKAYEPDNMSLVHTSPLLYYNSQSGVYELAEPIIHGAMLGYIDRLKINQRREVLEYIKHRAPFKQYAPKTLIAVQNGILNISTRMLIQPHPDIVVVNHIPVTFNPNIMQNEFLDKLFGITFGGDPEMISLAYEIIGYCLYPSNFMQKFFVMTGPGGNGKSKYLLAIQCLLGKDNVSTLSLVDIGTTFTNAELFKKMANLGADIDDTAILSTGILKMVVSGDPITVQKKGRDPFSFTPYATLIFSANEVPKIRDRSLGMYDRMMLLPFNVRIRNTAVDDKHIDEKLADPTFLSCLLNLALIGLDKLLKTGKFTEPAVVKAQLEQYQFDNNPVAQFVQAVEDGEISSWEQGGTFFINGSKTTTVYGEYKMWTERNGHKPLGDRMFGKEMKKLGYERKVVRIGLKLTRIYESVTVVLP